MQKPDSKKYFFRELSSDEKNNFTYETRSKLKKLDNNYQQNDENKGLNDIKEILNDVMGLYNINKINLNRLEVSIKLNETGINTNINNRKKSIFLKYQAFSRIATSANKNQEIRIRSFDLKFKEKNAGMFSFKESKININDKNKEYIETWHGKHLSKNTAASSKFSQKDDFTFDVSLSASNCVSKDIFENFFNNNMLNIHGFTNSLSVPTNVEIKNYKSFHPFIETEINYPNLDKNRIELLSNSKMNLFQPLWKTYFFDPYQLKDLESTLGKSHHFGKVELELPAESPMVTQWGTVLYLQGIKSVGGKHKNSGVPKDDNTLNQQFFEKLVSLKIPIHSRYRLPEAKESFSDSQINLNQGVEDGYVVEKIPIPFIFWECSEDGQAAEIKILRLKTSLPIPILYQLIFDIPEEPSHNTINLYYHSKALVSPSPLSPREDTDRHKLLARMPISNPEYNNQSL
ncbi:hypothetical protein BB559_004767 [Furculomyces boomerangus]|uniref:Protein PBN1 n=2 Tax=Harpellales TaxID=61421 RepID=A0A2T9YCW8_9FUNG|nr:hypothetical protein BB559_004767 [Furculomyces boomerangus]PVZ99434.1 hypothetical protein BB558_004519 [Smittium angustum]